jgi:hypothetical protein
MGWKEDVRYHDGKMYNRVITCTPKGKMYRNKNERENEGKERRDKFLLLHVEHVEQKRV